MTRRSTAAAAVLGVLSIPAAAHALDVFDLAERPVARDEVAAIAYMEEEKVNGLEEWKAFDTSNSSISFYYVHGDVVVAANVNKSLRLTAHASFVKDWLLAKFGKDVHSAYKSEIDGNQKILSLCWGPCARQSLFPEGERWRCVTAEPETCRHAMITEEKGAADFLTVWVIRQPEYNRARAGYGLRGPFERWLGSE